MVVENTEKEKEEKVENKLSWMEGNIDAGLDQDTFGKIQKGEIPLDDLTEDQVIDYQNSLEEAGQRLISGEDERETEDTSSEKTLEKEDKTEKKDKKAPLFERYKKATDDLNTANQKHENVKKQNEKISTELATLKEEMKKIQEKKITKPEDGEDYLQDDVQKSLQERMDKLEDMITAVHSTLENTTGAVSESLKSDSERLEAERKELEKSSGLLGIRAFQEETADEKFPFPGLNLKTTVPVVDLDAELSAFTEKIGGMENVNRYLSDEAYKKEQDEKGVKLSEEFIKNVEPFNEILMCNKSVSEGNFPDLMTAYLNRCYTGGRLTKAQLDAKLEGSNKAVEKISSDKSKTSMIPVDKGGGNASPKWTITKMREWLRKNPDVRPGTEEEKTQLEIMGLMKEEELSPGTLELV